MIPDPKSNIDPQSLKHFSQANDATLKRQTEKIERTYMSDYETGFNQASKDFWMDNKQPESYRNGYILGSYGKKDLTISVLLDRIFNGIKGILLSNLRDSNDTSERLKNHFVILENVLKMMSKELINSNIDVTKAIATLHGFTNGYVDGVIKGDNNAGTKSKLD